MMKNYDDLSKQFVGFLFHCRGGELTEPDPLSDREVQDQPEGTGNQDDLFIRCDDCGVNMTFTKNSPDQLDGEWRCPVCGQTVQEETPYDLLEEKNRAFEKKLYGDE